MTPQADPVLILVGTSEPYVCVGMHQDIEAEVDLEYCTAAGLPVLRRNVGGGAVYLDGNQIFFQFVVPVDRAPRRLETMYSFFVAPVLDVYHGLGIPARLRPINDIHVNDRKIGGTGAAQIEDATVFVGSFLLDFDTQTMARCLKVSSEKFRDKLKGTLDDYLTTIRRELGHVPPREDLVERFLRATADRLMLQPRADSLRTDELAQIHRWERELSDPEWLHKPGRRRFASTVKITGGVYLGESARKAPGGLVRARVLVRDGIVIDAQLSGDFYCLPPDGLSALELALRELDLRQAPAAEIDARLRALSLDLPGITAADIASTLLDALPRDGSAW
jgi:lipoate-protein ligase A